MRSITVRLRWLLLIVPVIAALMVGGPTVARADGTPAISTTSLANAQVSVAYAQTLTATGGTTPYTWTVIAGTLPAGLTLNATTGAIEGTPTTAGDSGFTVQATDFAGQVALKALSIHVAAAVSITTTALANAQVGVVYTQTLTATGGTTPYTWAVIAGAGVLPTGLTINATTGAINGTPTTTGDSGFTVQATDFAGQVALKALSIHVAAAATTPSTDVATACDSDLSGKPSLVTLCQLYNSGQLPGWAQKTIGRVILRIAGDDIHKETVHGRVTSVSDTTINVDTKHDAQVVVTDANTKFSSAGETVTIADVHTGDQISAKGTLNADGSLQAQSVRIQANHDSGHDQGTAQGCAANPGQRGEHGLAKGLQKRCNAGRGN